ncbi:MAG: hypothetical protein IKI34_00250, partial [Eubacterium sp.]|nr:hypothetical protein [Eubacterium sp.]
KIYLAEDFVFCLVEHLVGHRRLRLRLCRVLRDSGFLQFLGNATITDSIIRNILNKTLVVLCILLVCWLIYIWYLDWCRRQDKKAHSA